MHTVHIIIISSSIIISALQRCGRSWGGHSQRHYYRKCVLCVCCSLFAMTT